MWPIADTEFSKWDELVNLKNIITEVTRKHLLEKKRADSLVVEYKDKLRKSYRSAFMQKGWKQNARNMWKHLLSLDHGAAKVLLDIIEESETDGKVRPILELAKDRLADAPDDRKKCLDILELEPFLFKLENAFNLMLLPEARNINDISHYIRKVMDSADIPVTEERDRRGILNSLIACEQTYRVSGLQAFIHALYQHHCNVMEHRQGDPWLLVTENTPPCFTGKLMQKRDFDTEKLDRPGWRNGYYIDSIRMMFGKNDG